MTHQTDRGCEIPTYVLRVGSAIDVVLPVEDPTAVDEAEEEVLADDILEEKMLDEEILEREVLKEEVLEERPVTDLATDVDVE